MSDTTYTLATFTSTTFVAGDFSYTNLQAGLEGAFQISGGTQLLFVIPEPNTWSMLAGSLGMALGLQRFRRRRA